MCASSDPALAGIPLKPCCAGYVCREDPEHPTGDMFCMESEAIPLGGDCRVGTSLIIFYNIFKTFLSAGNERHLQGGSHLQQRRVCRKGGQKIPRSLLNSES